MWTFIHLFLVLITTATAGDLRTVTADDFNATTHVRTALLVDLPAEVRADFRLIHAGNALAFSGGGLTTGMAFTFSSPVTNTSIAVGGTAMAIAPALFITGQVRSMRRLEARGYRVNKGGLITGIALSSVAHLASTTGVGMMARGLHPVDALSTFGATNLAFHMAALIPFHLQTLALRRAWTVALADEVVEDITVRRPRPTVLPLVDLGSRRLGLTVHW